jgi:hypothetical protein
MTAANREHDVNHPPDLARLLDRLVDGELDAPARRSLLLRLEAEPGGWRRCALAFLEAQAWREALAGVASGSDRRNGCPDAGRLAAPMAVDADTGPVAARRVGFSRFRPWLDWAAVLVAAFALGWGVRHATGPRRAEPMVAAVAPRGIVNSPLTVSAPPEAPPPSPTAAPPEIAPVVEVEGHEPSVVAAVEWADARIPISLLSPVVRGRLERRGYEVEQRQALASVRLEDGRRVAVPVAEVKFRFVGGQTY